MSPLPHAAETIDLLKWVAAHPNQPFDPNMVVSLSTNHTSDWEWQAVLNQMNSLRQQNYVMQLKQDPSGSTYWTLTTSGANYLHALERFEKTKGQTEQTPPPAAEITTPMASPIQTPKKHVAPFLERASLRIRHLIRWEEMPTHLTAHLTYDLAKYVVFVCGTTVIVTIVGVAYWVIHRLIN